MCACDETPGTLCPRHADEAADHEAELTAWYAERDEPSERDRERFDA